MKLYRLRWRLHDFITRHIARYITRHKLWWNAEDAKRWLSLSKYE